jgi:hypothetical protein
MGAIVRRDMKDIRTIGRSQKPSFHFESKSVVYIGWRLEEILNNIRLVWRVVQIVWV